VLLSFLRGFGAWFSGPAVGLFRLGVFVAVVVLRGSLTTTETVHELRHPTRLRHEPWARAEQVDETLQPAHGVNRRHDGAQLGRADGAEVVGDGKIFTEVARAVHETSEVDAVPNPVDVQQFVDCGLACPRQQEVLSVGSVCVLVTPKAENLHAS